MARKKYNPDAPFQPPTGASYKTGLSVGYIRKGLREGTIPHIRVGKDYRVNMPLWTAQLESQSKREMISNA